MITHTFIWIFIIVIIICSLYPKWVTIQPSVVGNKVTPIGERAEYGLFKLKYKNVETSDFSVINSVWGQKSSNIYINMLSIGILMLVFSSISRKTHSDDPHLNLVLLLMGSFIVFITSISALFGNYAKYSITTNPTLIENISDKSKDDLLKALEKEEDNSDNPVFLAAIKKPSVCIYVLLHISLFMISYSLTTLSSSKDMNKFYF